VFSVVGLVVTGICALSAVLLTNPMARSAGRSTSPAQSFLAFDRIPHHTLISHWEFVATLLTFVVVLVGAMLSTRLLNSRWLAAILIWQLGLSLAAALAVELTRSPQLAMLFPWRITVVMVPLAAVFISVYAVDLVARRMEWRRVLYLACAIAAVLVTFGVIRSVGSLRERPSALVAALRSVELSGIGLVPLAAEDVRLNTQLAIFVDWKSHPYAPEELTEWVRRVSLVRKTESDPAALCKLLATESISWIVADSPLNASCLSDWYAMDVNGFVILERT
jgi:hypothetical protein